MKLIPHHLFPSQRNIQLYIRMNEILLYSTCIYAQGSLNRSLDPSGSMTYSQGTIKFLKIFLFWYIPICDTLWFSLITFMFIIFFDTFDGPWYPMTSCIFMISYETFRTYDILIYNEKLRWMFCLIQLPFYSPLSMRWLCDRNA